MHIIVCDMCPVWRATQRERDTNHIKFHKIFQHHAQVNRAWNCGPIKISAEFLPLCLANKYLAQFYSKTTGDQSSQMCDSDDTKTTQNHVASRGLIQSRTILSRTLTLRHGINITSPAVRWLYLKGFSWHCCCHFLSLSKKKPVQCAVGPLANHY
jgi:hypothetical protein